MTIDVRPFVEARTINDKSTERQQGSDSSRHNPNGAHAGKRYRVRFDIQEGYGVTVAQIGRIHIYHKQVYTRRFEAEGGENG